MSTQLKLTVSDELANRFKQVVVHKHGKLEVSVEGEEALRMYIDHHKLMMKEPKKDALSKLVGACSSGGNALEDLKKLDEGKL